MGANRGPPRPSLRLSIRCFAGRFSRGSPPSSSAPRVPPPTLPSSRAKSASAAWAVVLAGAVVTCTCAAGTASAADGDPAPGPDWSFIDTRGVTHSRDDAQGNASVLVFMATWCSSCRALAPKLASVEADHREQGLRFYTVTVDPNDDDGDLKLWKLVYDLPWPHGRDATGAMVRTFQVVSPSTVVVLDPLGHVERKWSFMGPSEADLRGVVGQTLDKAAAA